MDSSKFSHLDEEQIIFNFLQQLKPAARFCVDIGANDGMTMSNTFSLFKDGYAGLAVECDSDRFSRLALKYKNFPQVNLSQCKVTPENVVNLLIANGVPKEFAFLNLDVDGYDYFVLEQILSIYRPSLVCTEINENIPPPIKFTVKFDPEHFWDESHFFGQSIAQLETLCIKHEYALVELEYNNAFLIPQEISPSPGLTPEVAYKRGYLERSDRKEKFHWNADMEEIHRLSPQEALEFLRQFFSAYAGKFVCTL